MSQKNLNIHYDTKQNQKSFVLYPKTLKLNRIKEFCDVEADILDVTIGEPSSCIFDEIDDDLFEARDERTNELKGYKIFNFMKRAALKNMNMPLSLKIS